MRMILFFDLPTVTDANKRTYRKFHNYLLSEGFIMMQYSVYMKLTLNATSYKQELNNLKKNNDNTRVLVIAGGTKKKQFSDIEFILGEFETDVINTTDRIVVIE